MTDHDLETYRGFIKERDEEIQRLRALLSRSISEGGQSHWPRTASDALSERP